LRARRGVSGDLETRLLSEEAFARPSFGLLLFFFFFALALRAGNGLGSSPTLSSEDSVIEIGRMRSGVMAGIGLYLNPVKSGMGSRRHAHP